MSQSQIHLDLEHAAAEAATACDLTDLLHCLVVSTDRARRQMLASAAADGGWQTYLAEDAAAAVRRAQISTLQLAIVDLHHVAATQCDALLALLPRLASSGRLLLMVCGNDGDVQEELAARRNGVWMYLPGVVAGDGVQNLCLEARDIAARLKAPSPRPRRGASPSKKQRL